MFNNIYKLKIKRLLDVILASIALFLLSPLLMTICILIKRHLGSPVIFKQHRIGLNNKEFEIFKFRSMTDARDENGIYLPDEDRITPLGRFIRTTSIDELPSLLNIIRGEMSIIGPRPLPSRYLNRYTTKQLRRHEVKPGLSCPSTVDGRNAQSWEKQFEADIQYVDNLSFWVDFLTVINTIKIVLSHKGSTAEDGGARGEFIGNANIEDLKNDNEGNYMKLNIINNH